MSAWKTMESAPQGMDETVLVWDGKAVQIASVWWYEGDDGTDPAWFNGHYQVYPTHWQLLPAPPLPGESNARFIAGPATPSTR